MTIYVLDWIKDDLLKQGDNIANYTLLELKDILNQYKERFLGGNKYDR